jgi:peroxiredoxin
MAFHVRKGEIKMALTYSEKLDLGTSAPDFKLLGVDGKKYSLESFQEMKVLVVIFMCNHCPYVIAVQDRINSLAKKHWDKGLRVLGINSNDTSRYPEDDFDRMKDRAEKEGFIFPYVQDETQEVAKAYGAVCTPDPFVFENVDGKFLLRYHGRLDDNWKEPEKVTQEELMKAVEAIFDGKPVAKEQHPSMGCSIKWKEIS